MPSPSGPGGLRLASGAAQKFVERGSCCLQGAGRGDCSRSASARNQQPVTVAASGQSAGRGSTCRLIACSTGAGEPSGRRHGSCRPRRRGRSNVAPPVDGAAEHHRRALHPRKVARFSAEGHRCGIAMPAQGNSRVGTYMGIGNASTAGIPASPRHAGRRPPDRRAPGCPRRRPALRRRRTSSRRYRRTVCPGPARNPRTDVVRPARPRVPRWRVLWQRDERLHVAPGIQRQDQKFHRSPRSSW